MIEDKILQIYTASGLTRGEFALKLGIANAVLSHITSGRNKASLDLVITILNHYPHISADWLILNKGEMKRSPMESNIETIKQNLLDYTSKIKNTNTLAINKIQELEKEINDLK